MAPEPSNIDTEAKQAHISRSIGIIDDTLQTAIAQLTENTELQLKELTKMLAKYHDSIQQQIEAMNTLVAERPLPPENTYIPEETLETLADTSGHVHQNPSPEPAPPEHYRSFPVETGRSIRGINLLIVILLMACFGLLVAFFIWFEKIN